ncbi:MAG: hypothetical protein ACTSXL_00100 [Alphaproteobacteria bacterium]
MIKIEVGRYLAEKYMKELANYCEILSVVGQIRRNLPLISKIVILCVPNQIVSSEDLFDGFEYRRDPAFIQYVDQFPIIFGNSSGKCCGRVLPEGMRLELYMCNWDNYGVHQILRTGPDKFSKIVLSGISKNQGFQMSGGYLRRNGKKIVTKTERVVFSLLGLEEVPPEDRGKPYCIKKLKR